MPAKKTAAKASKSVKSTAATPKAKGKSTAAKSIPLSPTSAKTSAAGKASANGATATVKATEKAAVKADPKSNPPVSSKPAGGITATYVQRNPRPIAPPTNDAEDGEDGNLLSGPRNVQPYIVKRGEQYMSREQLDHFRQILESWKRDLMVEVDRTVSHMKDEAANFPDPNDRATQEEEFSLELRTRDRERKLIRKIEEALKRIEDGSYGYCLETGEEIGIKRLEARPVATLSIEAQERRERREKQYGDRDDRYR